jgi:hypothetical protein
MSAVAQAVSYTFVKKNLRVFFFVDNKYRVFLFLPRSITMIHSKNGIFSDGGLINNRTVCINRNFILVNNE